MICRGCWIASIRVPHQRQGDADVRPRAHLLDRHLARPAHLFLIAGAVTLTGVLLAVLVSPWFLLIPTLVGLNQLLMVAVGWCPMSLLLGRVGVPRLG